MKARNGFTLLEVMLAMGSLALVSTICYGAFYLGIRAVEKGEVAVVTAQRLRVASDVLIRQVKSAVPYPARNADEEVFPFFMGTATTLTFVSAAGQLGGGGMARVFYHVDDGPKLVLEESRSFSPDELGRDGIDSPGERAATVIEGFKSIRFQYLAPDDFEEGGKWTATWDSAADEVLPRAVRISIEGLPGMDTDVWVQEMPIMATNYGDNAGEVDDEDINDGSDDLADTGATGNGTGASGTNNRGNAGGADATDGGDDGGDE